MSRSVMYLGPKSMKFDNINGVPERKWHGAGQVIAGISPMQADKLTAHKEEFLDVTGMAERDIAQRAAKAKADIVDYKRRQHHSSGPNGEVTLNYATDEQLEAELKKRRIARGEPEPRAAAPAPATPAPKPTAAKQPAKGAAAKKGATLANAKPPAPEAPKSQLAITEAVEEVIGKLLEKNDGDDFVDGIPTRVAVERELGFTITETEYAIALGGKAPTDQPDKTGYDEGPGAQQTQ